MSLIFVLVHCVLVPIYVSFSAWYCESVCMCVLSIDMSILICKMINKLLRACHVRLHKHQPRTFLTVYPDYFDWSVRN